MSEDTVAAGVDRGELADWLRSEGFTEAQINDSFAPILLPARRALGDDGTLLSARQISEQSGMDLDLLRRILHAAGRPRAEDLDAALYLPVDGQMIGYAQQALNVGLGVDEIAAVVQVMAESLSRIVEVMRHAVLAALPPTDSEVEVSRASGAITSQVAPILGPMIQDMLRTQLLHAMQEEEVSTTERLAGRPLPGAGTVSVAFADLVGFTSLG
ncbi:MAG: adenylate cyclase regulatory domain-containing protein, partial [Mycobacterium sp.]|nr:adenylate cyclase regulatory domain-containing protein [Mycobacterium sp.]